MINSKPTIPQVLGDIADRLKNVASLEAATLHISPELSQGLQELLVSLNCPSDAVVDEYSISWLNGDVRVSVATFGFRVTRTEENTLTFLSVGEIVEMVTLEY